jgi:predicted DNA-binding transcriptional regulator AlpA
VQHRRLLEKGTIPRDHRVGQNRKERRDQVMASLPVRRGLSEVEAAIYLSLSPSFFRRLVDQGSMPRPRRAGARRIWDVEELDLAFKALPREGGELGLLTNANSADSWADYE